MKQKQAVADKRSRAVALSVLGAIIAAFAIVVVVIFVNHNRTNAAESAAIAVQDIPLSEVTNVPSTATADGGFLLATGGGVGGTPVDGVPTLSVYLDYMCPICGDFEKANMATLDQFVANGTANVVLYPLGFLDGFSQGSAFSTRATAAFAWVADQAPGSALAFHEAIFANQPHEQTTGLSNDQLANIARQAGVPSDVADGIASGEARRTFGQWVYSATNATTSNTALVPPGRDRFAGTPTLAINGEIWQGNWQVPGALEQAIADAGSK
jgi:protein-disulfide isomerase